MASGGVAAQPILGSSQHVRSLWALPDGATALPEGELPGSADIVVAGAGVVGATTALLLAEAGRDVVLLDLDDPLQNSTTIGSTAKVTAGQGMKPRPLGRPAGWAGVHRPPGAHPAGDGVRGGPGSR